MERIDLIQTDTSLAEGGRELVERINLLWGLHHKQIVHSKQIFFNEITHSYRIFNTLLDGNAKESCKRAT